MIRHPPSSTLFPYTPLSRSLMLTLKAGGAQLALCASNPLSTQDDTAAALVKEYDIAVYAHKGEDHARYYRHIEAVLTRQDRKSTRLNSSHGYISYAGFCLKK